MSTSLEANRAGLAMAKIPETPAGSLLQAHKAAQFETVERASLPPCLRREFDAITKATSDIKHRDRKAKYSLTSEVGPEAKRGLYVSMNNEYSSTGGSPAPSLKNTINGLQANFKLAYAPPKPDLCLPISISEDVANLKDFEGYPSPDTTRSSTMSPTKDSFYFRSPTLNSSTRSGFETFNKSPPFMATKVAMKNLKNESACLTETTLTKRISAGPKTTEHIHMFIPHSLSPIRTNRPNLTF